ncbi:MAG: biotin/lipoyl-binding protein [Egibacteraceae bacterium]
MTTRRVLLVTAIAVVVLLIVRVVFFREEPAPEVRTVEVQRGTVRTAVTGTGTVEPSTQQNVSFGQDGQLTEIGVKVGDRVRGGQVLAKIDPGDFRNALQDAVGALQQAQATLEEATEQNTVETAENELEAARQAVEDTKKQVSETIEAGEDRVANDRRQLEYDRNTLDRLEDQLERDEEQLERDRATLELAEDAFRAHGCDQVVQLDPVQCMTDEEAVVEAESAVNASKIVVEESRADVRAAKATVLDDQAQLSEDENQLAIDRASGQQSINDAQAVVTSAEDALESARISRPNDIAEQQGGVTSAQAQVNSAQQDLADTALLSPFDATVVAVNAMVGERVTVSGVTTPQSPGSKAPQPQTATTVSPGTAGASTELASPVMVLAPLLPFQVIVPYAEADATQVQPGQKADVTFDALPGLTLPGTVVAVAPGPTIINNVTNYFVTVGLGQLDPRLLTGLTANTEVVAAEVENVLVVPNAAIQRTGEQTFVTVLLDDGTQQRVPVQTGMVGDTTTQVISGLKPGDRVVLPTVRSPSG